MALEDIANNYREFAEKQGSARNFTESVVIPEERKIQAMRNYFGPLPREELSLMLQDINGVNSKIDSDLKKSQDKIIGEVSKNYEDIVAYLSGENVLGNLAFSLSGEDGKIREIEEKKRKGDEKGLRKAYSETFDNEDWKDYILNHASLGFIK